MIWDIFASLIIRLFFVLAVDLGGKDVADSRWNDV